MKKKSAEHCKSKHIVILPCSDIHSRVVLAFRSYSKEASFEVSQWRRQYSSLSNQHKEALSSVPGKCDRAIAAAEANQLFFNTMLHAADEWKESLTSEALPPMADMEKVKYVLKNLVRDWAAEGAVERDMTYSLILSELKSLFYQRDDWTHPPRCLLPGCGLARLVAEIASVGFQAEGNEFSYFMLIPSSFMLNNSIGTNTWTIHPWILSTCNQVSDEEQLRAVSLPDVDVRAMMRETRGSMSMVAGDFVEVYSREEYGEAFDCVVTSFFIDTAHNVLEYIDVIYSTLRPGGYWINLGPLLYHWAESNEQDQSIEISLQDIEQYAAAKGLSMIRKSFVQAPYLANAAAMFQTVYRAVFWTMLKIKNEDVGN